MKIITTITFFIVCASNMTVTAQYNLLDPKLFATGHLELDTFYSADYATRFEAMALKYSTIQPQFKKITYQQLKSGNWNTQSRTVFNSPTSNCAQPYSIYYYDNYYDSIIIVNGRRSEVIQYDVNLNSQIFVYQRSKYYYSNTGRLDSIQVKNFDPDYPGEYVLRFSTDAKGRTIFSSSYARKFYEYDANGNISRFVIENYDTTLKKWVFNHDYVLSWSAGKITSVRTFEVDSIRLTFNYFPNTSNIKNITGERKRGNNPWVQTSDLINITKNTKSYPTRLDYKVLNTTTGTLNLERIYEYAYYPNDTIVYQYSRSAPTLPTPTYVERELYEYCGLPSLTPTAELQSLDFKIYPNPTNDVLNIELPQNTEGPSIEIFNTMGNMVSKTKQLNVDVSGLSTGIYFVQIKTKDRVGVRRFVVNR